MPHSGDFTPRAAALYAVRQRGEQLAQRRSQPPPPPPLPAAGPVPPAGHTYDPDELDVVSRELLVLRKRLGHLLRPEARTRAGH